MSKTWKTIALIVVTLGAIVLSQLGCSSTAARVDAPDQEQRTISVSGSGTVSTVPDEVVLQLGVETMAETASGALSQNNRGMEGVISALTEAGVPTENVQTQTVQLTPQYETPQGETGTAQEPKLVGYVASNIVEARTRDLGAMGELLDQAVQAGANRIQGLRFEVSDPGELLDQAREAAWQDAEEKAQQLATLANVELGDVVSISESTTTPRPVGLGSAVERAVPVQPGAEDIQVDLQVVWSLR